MVRLIKTRFPLPLVPISIIIVLNRSAADQQRKFATFYNSHQTIGRTLPLSSQGVYQINSVKFADLFKKHLTQFTVLFVLQVSFLEILNVETLLNQNCLQGERYKVKGGCVYKVQEEGVYKEQSSENFSEKGGIIFMQKFKKNS